MSESIIKMWPIVLIVGGGILTWAVTLAWVKVQVQSNKDNILKLWDNKSDKAMCAEHKIKMDGIDRWTREHEKDSNLIRLKMAERFSSLEKSLEIGAANHGQMIQSVGRLDASICKLEEKFDVFVTRLEKALLKISSS